MYYQPIDPLTTGLNIASILMLAVSCLYIYVTTKHLEDLFTYYFPPTQENTNESENTDTQPFYPTFPPTPEHYQQRLKEHQNAHHNTTMD